MAIEHALQILSWHENLQKEEVPPEYLWEDTEGMEQWWESVEAKRNDGVETTRGRQDDREEVPAASGMQENDYARFLKQG